MIIATKGAQPYPSSPHLSRLSHNEIVSDLDGSLPCLQIENIDLYWLQRDDPTRPVADILETLNAQVLKGKISSFGCSNWHTKRIIEAMQYASQQNIAGFVANVLMWSFAVPNYDGIEDTSLVFMDSEMLEFHRKTYANTENKERLGPLQAVSNELSLSIPTLLLAYLSNQPFPTFPISGNTDRKQLLENLQAGDVVLSVDTLRYLDDGFIP